MTKRMVRIASAVMAVMLVAPATAHADDPVPGVDQVVGIMAELTDPNRPAASKTDVVTPGLAPDEAGTTDNHLNTLNSRGYLPFNFVVTDIQPAPGSTAGATVAAPKDLPYRSIRPVAIVLISQSGHWSITHDAAMAFLNQMWSSARHHAGFV